MSGKYTRLIFLAGILAGLFMLSGCGQEKSAHGQLQTGPAEVGIVVMQPQRVSITSELPGRTSAYLIAEVRPQVGGIVQKRLFTEGADVKAAEVLYQIDPATYKATHDSAKASLSKAEASLITTRLKAQRYTDLVRIKAVSQQDCDDAVSLLKQGEADVELNKASVESARINLAYTRVTSPISGRIGKSSVTTGALVTANQSSALATVQQLDPIYVDVTQSSYEMLRLKKSLSSGHQRKNGVNQAPVTLLLEDGTEYPLKGTLGFSDVTVDQTTGSISLRAIFPNPDHLLLPGMYVRALLEEGVEEQAILAPQQGVTRDSKGNATALVVRDDSTVEQRTLRITRAIGDKWLVAEGLKPGDKLILEGLQKVAPGAPVKAVQINPTVTAEAAIPADARQ
ncbi:MAG: efflux RND transporter periplasmic adaptor subunit [Syntrophobacter sp.]